MLFERVAQPYLQIRVVSFCYACKWYRTIKGVTLTKGLQKVWGIVMHVYKRVQSPPHPPGYLCKTMQRRCFLPKPGICFFVTIFGRGNNRTMLWCKAIHIFIRCIPAAKSKTKRFYDSHSLEFQFVRAVHDHQSTAQHSYRARGIFFFKDCYQSL